MKEYIHYGCKKFDPQGIRSVKNQMYVGKPRGGFWASAVDAKYGWKTWCKDNDFCVCDKNCSVSFTLKPSAKILEIHNLEDADKIIRQYPMPLDSRMLGLVCDIMPSIDWEKISKEYDGVEIFLSDCWDLYNKLYGWDCDSLVIFNGDCIAIIDKDKSVADSVLEDDEVEIPFVVADEEEISF